MAGERFADGGAYLRDFVDRIDVCCPRCELRALVRGADPETARVTCGHCGFAAAWSDTGWLGPLTGLVRRRCPTCHEWVERRYHGPAHDHPVHLDCSCGWSLDETVRWEPVPRDTLDPTFGLELWLTAPFRSETVWAYNVDHLRFLRDYVHADLRRREPHRNRSLASALPRWMKSAKHRTELAGVFEQLEARTAQS